MMSMSVTMHPLWQSGGIILAAGVTGALLLQLLVHRVLPAGLRRRHTELGAAIFSVIGVTYAVLLAFMATTAWEQYSAAETLARHEADLIGSAYAASEGIVAPAGAEIRADLTAYVKHVIAVEWPAQVAGTPLPDIDPLLARLDRTVLTLNPAGLAGADVQGFLIDKVSGIVAARRDRKLATHGDIPHLVWLVLLSGGVLTVGFSFVLGAPTAGLHLIMTAALVASGLLVILLIIGLSSPFHGAVTIPPDAYEGVLHEIQSSG